MAEQIISLRPHHIDRFVEYYHQFQNIFSNPANLEEYGKNFARELKNLFDFIASGGKGEEYILVKNGLDSICDICTSTRKKKICSNPDSLSIWNGSGETMQRMDLREGWLYPLKDFLEKVKQLYPDRNLNKQL